MMTPQSSMQQDNILDQASSWLARGHCVALATVISTWGSSPRPVGSQLAINNTKAFVGSVSGGCIEGSVIETALAVMQSGKPSILKFSVSNELAWEVGLACGGTIEVYVERQE